MGSTLTILVGRVQGMLSDAGTLFTSGVCTTAIRMALAEWNLSAPDTASASVDVVPAQEEYALSAGGFAGLLRPLEVRLTGEEDALKAVFFFDANTPKLRLEEAQTGGTLTVRFTKGHTIDGLDSETTSTLKPDQENVLLSGACANAITLRLVSRVEGLNLAAEVIENYEQARAYYRKLFEDGLRFYSARRVTPGEKLEGWGMPDA